ncbi:MAG: cysteine--tRNA ligase [Hyphomicrobiaceae bacterium]
MSLTLYNTLTRRKEPFRPIDPKNVRFYVCGPTVYDFAHIGNARPIIVFDVLFRLLRHTYGADHVIYVRNITDIEDKINARAAEAGVPIRELTERTVKQLHADVAALGVLAPTVEPRATDHIAEMTALIETLVAKGHAYVAEDHVLFDVPSMPDYGKFSGRGLSEMEAGARVEVAPYKRDQMDFVLWKPSPPGIPAWSSPCGIAAPGRPGWHIECSAMADKWLWQEAKAKLSKKGLARPHAFDIHGGGIDLVFPHHENEVAQSRCAHGTPAFANVWMHNGFLQVEGEKMAKSLGNFITIDELLKEWPRQVLYFNMLRTHYRQPLDWTQAGLRESTLTLGRFKSAVAGADGSQASLPNAFLDALCDDLNTPAAIAELHALAARAMAVSRVPADASIDPAHEAAHALKRAIEFLGLGDIRLFDPNQTAARQVFIAQNRARIDALIAARNAARKAKDFKEADRIRAELDAMNVQLKDTKHPKTGDLVTTWEIKQ